MKEVIKNSLLVLLFAFIFFGCIPLPDALDPNADLTPPLLEQILVTGSHSVSLAFDEQTEIVKEEIITEPSLQVASVETIGNTTIINFSEQLVPGLEYLVRVEARDMKGNSMFLLSRFYGYNNSIPVIVINEFTTRGSASHPDCVEIKVIESGNLAGVAFFHGTKTLFTYQYVFPSCEVKKGDFILLHTKPENIPEEIDEITDKTLSGGKDASANAFDFWIPKGTGLSGNNGTITLYSQPFGSIMDAVLYTNRTSVSDTEFNGFGSRTVAQQAEELAIENAWLKQNDSIAPEDAVFIESSTATRSVCRDTLNTDTNSNKDWHIVPTKGYTFGTENTEEEYTP